MRSRLVRLLQLAEGMVCYCENLDCSIELSWFESSLCWYRYCIGGGVVFCNNVLLFCCRWLFIVCHVREPLYPIFFCSFRLLSPLSRIRIFLRPIHVLVCCSNFAHSTAVSCRIYMDVQVLRLCPPHVCPQGCHSHFRSTSAVLVYHDICPPSSGHTHASFILTAVRLSSFLWSEASAPTTHGWTPQTEQTGSRGGRYRQTATGTYTNRQTDTQTDRHTDRQTDRQRERERGGR